MIQSFLFESNVSENRVGHRLSAKLFLLTVIFSTLFQLLEDMTRRVRARPDMMKQRQRIVEHPFGTIKRAMNQDYFLMRGLKKVGAEMSLTVLGYNIKRAITIIGVKKMIEAVT